jgi:hypothetical protein
VPDLARTQRLFGALLRDASLSVRDTRLFAGDDALVERRLAIYRGNVVGAAAKALAAAYPVIEQIVGEEFFFGLARAHLRECPSTSGNLYDFGEHFADFLARFEPAREFPYLADLAHVEWAVHCAGLAADAGRIDMRRLAALSAAQQARLRWCVAPGTAIVVSSQPVVRLWTLHQDRNDREFSVDWQQAETALVARQGLAVSVAAIDAAHAAFIGALIAQQPLEAVAQAALAVDPGFDFQGALANAIGSGLVCDFFLDPLDTSNERMD